LIATHSIGVIQIEITIKPFVGMRTIEKIKSSLILLAQLHLTLNEKGGPSAEGQLFEQILDLQQEILDYFGLPPTPENEELLWFQSLPSERQIEDRIQELNTAATEYLSSNAISDLRLLRNAQQTKGNPMYVLPELKVPTHTYTLFVYNKILLPQKDSVENVLQEFRVVGQYDTLDALGRLKEGILDNAPQAVGALKERGVQYIDQFMIDNSNLLDDDNN
jgi:hypothetical protein